MDDDLPSLLPEDSDDDEEPPPGPNGFRLAQQRGVINRTIQEDSKIVLHFKTSEWCLLQDDLLHPICKMDRGPLALPPIEILENLHSVVSTVIQRMLTKCGIVSAEIRVR